MINISDLILDDYGCSDWFVPTLEGDEKVTPMPRLESDEDVKEGK